MGKEGERAAEQSPRKGKRSLMDLIQRKSSPGKGKKRQSLRSPKKSVEKIEFRDMLSPNTQQLVNNSRVKANKIFNDSVHTHITLEPVCVRIVDTPQYQRLHGLKQLGTTDYVFRGATHTRFEHSMGVAHMAARVVRTLKNNQPELGITEDDVLCVKIAGLCHDLGHGPFSHVFDGVFIKSMYPNGIDSNGKKWRHEDGSVEMFRYLLSDNNIDITGEYGLSAKDLIFIEEIISGTEESQRKGRHRNKYFLYDVVNNARSGLDVDKLDYFQRDMARSGVSTGPTSRDFDRFIELAYVMRAEPINTSYNNSGAKTSHRLTRNGSFISRLSGSTTQSQDDAIGGRSNLNNSFSTRGGMDQDDEFPFMICYPEKMVRETVSLFATRFNMHQQVYTHKSVKQVEFMITDALQLADPYMRIQGSVTERFPSGEYKMSETIHDMKAFMQMKDSILDIICFTATHNPLLQPAADLVNRIHRRQLYRYIGMTSSLLHSGGNISSKSEKEILEEILVISMRNREEVDTSFNLGDDSNANLGFEVSGENGSGGFVELTENDLIVEKMHIHYGMKDLNPVDRMRFFTKHANLQPNAIARKIDESVYETVLPRVFEDRAIRLFCRDPEKADAARAIFEQWCEEANALMPFPSSLSQTENSQFSQPDGDALFSGEF